MSELPLVRGISSTPAATARIEGFDVMRVLAAIAVIWIHTPNSEKLIAYAELGRFAVPFFTISAVFLAVLSAMKTSSRSLLSYASDRVRRLYLPMLGWSAIYLVVVNKKYIAGLREDVLLPSPGMLLHGSTIHLWFIPFLMVASICAYAVGKVLATCDDAMKRRYAIWFLVTGVLVSFCAPAENILDLRVIGSAWHILPAVFWGLAFACIYSPAMLPFLQNPLTVGLLAVALVFGAANAPSIREELMWLLVNTSAIAAFLIGFGLTHPAIINAARPLAPLTYGAYLGHGIALGALGTLLFSVFALTHSPANDLMLFALAVPATFFMVWLLRRWRYTAWLMP